LVVWRRGGGGVGCDAALFLLAFEGCSGWSTGFAVALGAAFDAQGLGIGEFDLDVFLFDTGEFAVQLVAILDFLYIEARLERAELRDVAEIAKVIALTRALVRGVIVEKTEERGKFARGEAWEGKHCSDWSGLRSDFDDSVGLRELVGDAVGLHVIACCCGVLVLVSDDVGLWWTGRLLLYL
jgi:hypothetical protein